MDNYDPSTLSHGKWKYIKREWKNGKWRYWYKDDLEKENRSKEEKVTSKKKTSDEKTKKKSKKSIIAKVKKLASKGKKFVSKLFKKSVKEVSGYKNKGEAYVKAKFSGSAKKESFADILRRGQKQNAAERKAKEKAEKLAKEKAYKKAQEKERKEKREPELKKQLAKLTKKNTLFKKFNPLPDLNLKKKATTLDEDQAAINPNYKSGTIDYTKNCSYCALAYDLRRRGYDVEAKPKNHRYDMTIQAVAECYKTEWKSPITSVKARDKITESIDKYDPETVTEKQMSSYLKGVEKEFKSYGEGARGVLAVQWDVGGGHAVNWEVENGEVVIRDAQTNKKHTLDEYSSRVKLVQYIRTDDLEPDEDAMKYVRNRRSK